MHSWKKTLGRLLYVAAICCMVWGCSARADQAARSDSQDTAVAFPVQDNKEETVAETIVMTFQTIPTSITEDLEAVEQAVNDISVPAIGVAVKFKLVDATEAYSKYPLWISNKEPVDLMMLNFQDITQYINKNMLYSLDDLLYTNAPDIMDIIENRHDLTEGAVQNGFTYGVATARKYRGIGRGIVIPRRCVEETGLNFDPEHIYTMEELTDWFAALKALYPDSYPLGLITAGNNFSVRSYFMNMEDSVGGESTSGTLLDTDKMEIYNGYAAEEYLDFLTYLRQWYTAGYLYPDGALTEYTTGELMARQMILAYPFFSNPDSLVNEDYPEEMVCLRTTDIHLGRQHSKSGFWVIPSSSEHADGAMRFLNLMYADVRVVNLLTWGIEGEHYQIVDRENGLIAWPDGSGPTGFYNPLGLYGDVGKAYTMGTLELKEQMEAFERQAVYDKGAADGFIYSSVNVSRELDEIQKVITKYVPVLESGSVSLEKYYPEFLEALKQAGMETVIDDKQRQLSAWLAANNKR